MCSQKTVSRLSVLIDQREDDRGEVGAFAVEISVRSKVNKSVLAKIRRGRRVAVSAKTERLEIRRPRCYGENLIRFLTRITQASNLKLSRFTIGDIFEAASGCFIVRHGRSVRSRNGSRKALISR